MADKPVVRVQTDSESIISMVLGAMVVLVIGALLFSYVRDWRAKNTADSNNDTELTASPVPVVVEELPKEGEVQFEKNEKGESTPVNLPAKYTVKAGDSTWKIAQAFYGSGFNYVDIENANNLKADAELNEGQELLIPKVTVRTADTAGVNTTDVKAQPTSAPEGNGPAKGDDTQAQKALQE
jgi:LysM repeat protein